MRPALIALFFAQFIPAQIKIDIHQVKGGASERLLEVERRWRVAQRVSYHAPSTPEEMTVLAALTKEYTQVFRPPLQASPLVATFTENGQDILVIRWRSLDDQLREPIVIVWNTPEETAFLFPLKPGSVKDDAAADCTFQSLLAPTGSDPSTRAARGVSINIARDSVHRQTIAAGGLSIAYFPIQFDLGLLNWFDLRETAGSSFLSVGFSQHVLYELPANLRSINERFPLLEKRVPGWTKQRLIRELDHHANLLTQLRDQILTKELLRRELTDDEMLTMLRSRDHDPNLTLLRAIVQTRQTLRYAGALRAYLETAKAGGYWGQDSAFGAVEPSAEANFTDVALSVLRRNPKAAPAFFYAARRGTTEGDYSALSEVSQVENSQQRQEALSRMRSRLGLPAEASLPLGK